MDTKSPLTPLFQRGEPRTATIEEDAELLGPWTRAFEALCGAPVLVEPLDASNPSAGRRLTFPRVFDPIDLIGGTGHFRRNRAMTEHLRRMGFDWDADGRVMTVPAPGAFNARLADVAPCESGFLLAYANGTEHAMPLGPWMLRYMDGVITLLVNAPAYYESLLSGGRRPRSRADPRWGLLSVAHDLSVHALNYHLIPRAAVADVARRIRAALPERAAAWTDPATVAPLTLTYFFDNDLNRYTYAVWCRCERPQDFGAIFLAEHNYAQLVAALEIRLEETQSGRGDVASGDFDDMGKLTETSFEVRAA
jgi:hypothetical protein